MDRSSVDPWVVVCHPGFPELGRYRLVGDSSGPVGALGSDLELQATRNTAATNINGLRMMFPSQLIEFRIPYTPKRLAVGPAGRANYYIGDLTPPN